MTGMTDISTAAAVAREHARSSDGRFGTQEHTAPELALGDYAYPALRDGITPEQVGINTWIDIDRGRVVTAYVWGPDEDGWENADLEQRILPVRELAVTADQAADLYDDHWTTLAEAPTWLRDAVTPELVDTTDPTAARQNSAWQEARHRRLTEAGALATAYDNDFIADFETQFPANTPQDAAAGLHQMESADDPEDPERELAAAELSRRAAHGATDPLIDLRALRPGDHIDFRHLAEHRPAGADTVGVVRGLDPRGAEGTVSILLDDGSYLSLPTGARIPARPHRNGASS